MRFYTVSGKKFESGFYGGSTDSSVFVYKNKTDSSINMNNIQFYIRSTEENLYAFLHCFRKKV